MALKVSSEKTLNFQIKPLFLIKLSRPFFHPTQDHSKQVLIINPKCVSNIENSTSNPFNFHLYTRNILANNPNFTLVAPNPLTLSPPHQSRNEILSLQLSFHVCS
jgi:hypothetical protein